jgi:hypothetical protein
LQVTDAARPAGQQLDGVALLDVLREHQHGQSRDLLAGTDRGSQAFVGERRRHADVDDREVRPVFLDRAEQVFAVVHRRRGFDALVREQPLQTGSQQDGVLSDHYPHAGSPSVVGESGFRPLFTHDGVTKYTAGPRGRRSDRLPG